jgi:hypothetical protein
MKENVAKYLGVNIDSCIVSLSKKDIESIDNGSLKAFVKSYYINNGIIHLIQTNAISMISLNKEISYIKNLKVKTKEIIITRDNIICDDIVLDRDEQKIVVESLGYNDLSKLLSDYKNHLDNKTRYKACLVEIIK